MRAISLILFTPAVCAAQETSLQNAVVEAGRLRQWKPKPDAPFFDPERRHFAANLHGSLRDWIESRLPESKEALVRELPMLENVLNAELWRVGLLAPQDAQEL